MNKSGHDRLESYKNVMRSYGLALDEGMTAKEWLKSQLKVWQFFYEARDIRDKCIHPAPFPVALAARVIRLYSYKGDVILDPFLGSGTTCVAALQNSRHYVGYADEEFCKLSEKRIAPVKLQDKLPFPLSNNDLSEEDKTGIG
jgi:DNA modification methylase